MATLQKMRQLAREGAADIDIRNLAVSLTRGLPQKDFQGEACRLLSYCRDYIRYVRDIRDIETLHAARTVLTTGSGDCDDKSILLGALLLSIGHSPRFIAVAFRPEQYSHVWVQDHVGGRWLDLEPTEPIQCGNRIPSRGAFDHMTLAV